MVLESLPEHVRENRRHWDEHAAEWVAGGERCWREEPSWGIWSIPEADLGMFPENLSGRAAIELGCGTAYVSAWMMRRGARCLGIDNSEGQLATARRLAAEHGLAIEFHHGNAEQVPRPDASFDFAISEYGASIWCDPYVWIPEAHRLLRPGGQLSFLSNAPWVGVCTSLDGSEVGDRMVRDYFGLHRLDWRHAEVDPGGIEFQLPISSWFRLFQATGFEVLDFREIQAPPDATGVRFGLSAEWAHRFPSEIVWKLRKR